MTSLVSNLILMILILAFVHLIAVSMTWMITQYDFYVKQS